MGVSNSSFLKKITYPILWMWPFGTKGDSNSMSLFNGATPFVYKRRSSMFMDEDGDTAHEFYEEKVFGRSVLRVKMLRRIKHLKPQGEIDLPFPRLNCDLPIIMCEALVR